MSGVTFDPNVWYQFYYNTQTTTGMQAIDINTSGTGAIIGRNLNVSSSATSFQWQVMQIGSKNYVFRSRYLGRQWYMGTFWQPVSSLPGMDTRVRTENYLSPDLVPNTAQWLIDSTNDGSGMFYLSPVANGTGVHLESLQGIGYLRDAASGSGTSAMKWSFTSIAAINDAQWSSTSSSSLAAATATSATGTLVPASNTAATTPTSSADTASASSSSASSSTSGSSNSTPIGAIIGGVLGGLALILLAVAALGFHHRQKRLRAVAEGHPGPPSNGELEGRQVYSPAPTQSMTTISYPSVIHHPGVHEKPAFTVGRKPVPQYAGSQYSTDAKHPAKRTWDPPTELPASSEYYYKPSPGGTTDSGSTL